VSFGGVTSPMSAAAGYKQHSVIDQSSLGRSIEEGLPAVAADVRAVDTAGFAGSRLGSRFARCDYAMPYLTALSDHPDRHTLHAPQGAETPQNVPDGRNRPPALGIRAR